jgi:hypothetical protein
MQGLTDMGVRCRSAISRASTEDGEMKEHRLVLDFLHLLLQEELDLVANATHCYTLQFHVVLTDMVDRAR